MKNNYIFQLLDSKQFYQNHVCDSKKNREFRNAWVDITEGPAIDICCEKAQQVILQRMRYLRAPKLAEQDNKLLRAIRDELPLNELKKETQNLLDITETVKGLKTKGKINDKKLLDIMRKELALLED